MLQISLTGPFRVADSDGRDLTPKSAKARGLLAILALSPDLRRSRMWLRDRLWSASGDAQASDSLRQCLSEIRRAFGAEAAALIADRRSVSLSEDIDVVLPVAGVDGPDDLLSDIDVSDPQFAHWRQSQRDKLRGEAAFPNALSIDRLGPKEKSVVVIQMAHRVPDGALWAFQSLRENITLLLHEGGDVDVVTEAEPMPQLRSASANYFFAVLDLNVVGDQLVTSARLDSGETGNTLWSSGQKWLRNDGSDETIWNLHRLAFRIQEQAAAAIAQGVDRAGGASNAFALAMRGRNRFFEFTREALVDADRLFATAYELEPRGSFLAWRHFLRNTATFEHLTDNFLEPIDQVDMIEQAVIDGSHNSFVLAVASQDAFVRKGDLRLAQTLVGDAIERNAVSPLALAFQSNIHVLAGESEKAVAAAARGHDLVTNTSYRGFSSMFLCMSYVANGDYENAVFHGNLSHYLMPRFVAAQRFLYVLNEAMGRKAQAQTVFHKIRKREPDFSKAHLFRSDYPVSTLRRMGIMDLIS